MGYSQKEVSEALEAGLADFRAQLRQPQLITSLRKYELVLMMLVAVDGAETPRAIKVSTDGNDSAALFVPKSVLHISKRDGRFMIATLPGWCVMDRKFCQASVPTLDKQVAWTEEERAAWRALRTDFQRQKSNRRPRGRFRRSNLAGFSRNDTA